MSVGNLLFATFLLVLMLDPGNSILKLKDITFILFFGFNLLFLKPNLKMLIPVGLAFGVLSLGYLIAIMQDSLLDEAFLVASFKAMAPLFLLLWVHHYDVLRIARAPAFITCVFILIVYGFVASNEAIEYALWKYSKENDEIVMITTRNLLGVRVFGMYYRSIVSIIPILFLFYFYASKRWTYLIASIILTATFMISGTRAMMLAPFIILIIVFYRKIIEMRKVRYYLFPILTFAFLAFVFVIILLATQQGDESNAIKYGHLESYAELFNSHPEYLIWGQGTGTMFYTIGFNRLTPITEWIYIELLRNYGLMSLIILGIYVYPLYVFYRHRNDRFTFGLGLTYASFLLVAGTNPFLLNSQGMTVLWMMYSHALSLHKPPSNDNSTDITSHSPLQV